MTMALALDTPWMARSFIPKMQRKLDSEGREGRRFHVHRVSAYATVLSRDSEIWRQLYSILNFASDASSCNVMLVKHEECQQQAQFILDLAGDTSPLNPLLPKQESVDWQADSDDDLGDAAVLHHLHQQAATVPFLSGVISQRDRGNAATTLTGTALSAPINAKTQGRPLSSFHHYSYRLSSPALGDPESSSAIVVQDNMEALLPYSAQKPTIYDSFNEVTDPSRLIVWAGPERDDHLVFWQVQVDFVDLYSRRRPTSCPPKRRRTAFNQFLQVSHSPGVEYTTRGNPLPRAKRFNGVQHRTDRNIWVAEMKPTEHKTKQDFGNFKSEAEAARAVDAAFHHYGRPDLLNFPDTSLQFLSTRPTATGGLDKKAKVKFVKGEAKLLLAATAASSPPHSTHSALLQIQELSASPRRRCPSSPLRPRSEISSPLRFCRSPDEVDAVALQPQPRMLQDYIYDLSSTRVLTNWETLNSVQSAEQGWYLAEDSSSQAAPPNAGNPTACESPSSCLDSILRLSPAPTYSRSPSPTHFQDEVAYALLEHQSI